MVTTAHPFEQQNPKLIHNLEAVVLDKTIALLKSGAVTVTAAQSATKEFLSLRPFTSHEDVLHKLQAFVQNHTHFASVLEDAKQHVAASRPQKPEGLFGGLLKVFSVGGSK